MALPARSRRGAACTLAALCGWSGVDAATTAHDRCRRRQRLLLVGWSRYDRSHAYGFLPVRRRRRSGTPGRSNAARRLLVRFVTARVAWLAVSAPFPSRRPQPRRLRHWASTQRAQASRPRSSWPAATAKTGNAGRAGAASSRPARRRPSPRPRARDQRLRVVEGLVAEVVNVRQRDDGDLRVLADPAREVNRAVAVLDQDQLRIGQVLGGRLRPARQ